MRITVRILAMLLCVSCLTGCCLITNDHSAPIPQTTEQEKQPLFTAAPTEPTEVTLPVQTTEATTAPTEATAAPTEPATTAPSVDDHEEKILQIRRWYQSIVLDDNLERRFYGAAAEIYLQKGQIVAITEFRQLTDAFDPALETVHFYYRNGEPFFVFIEYDHWEYEEVRLYFDQGELIRWKIDQNDPNDNIPNAQWQGYYTQACRALQNAPTEPLPY